MYDVMAMTDFEKTLKMNCSYCDRRPGTLVCSGCKLRTYCSKECQRSSWKCGHKEECAQFQQETEKTRIRIQKMNQLLDQLKVKPTKETCIICYKECSMPELSQLPCKHSFCSNCLCQTPHEPYKLPCPLCRLVCNPEQSVFGFANLDLLLEAYIIYQRCNPLLAKQFMYHAKREYARLILLKAKIDLPNEYIFVYYRIHIAILEKKYHEAIGILGQNEEIRTKDFLDQFLKGNSTSRQGKSLMLSMAMLMKCSGALTHTRDFLVGAYNEPGNEKSAFIDQEILYQLVELNIKNPEVVSKNDFELFRQVEIAINTKLPNCNGIYCLMGSYYEQEKDLDKAVACYKLSIRYDYRLLECDHKNRMRQKICSVQKQLGELKNKESQNEEQKSKGQNPEMTYEEREEALKEAFIELGGKLLLELFRDLEEGNYGSDAESDDQRAGKENPENKKRGETEDSNKDNHRPKKKRLRKSSFHFKS